MIFTEEQRAAIVMAQAIAAEIEMQAMIAENKYKESCGESPTFMEKDFLIVIDKYKLREDIVHHFMVHGEWE